MLLVVQVGHCRYPRRTFWDHKNPGLKQIKIKLEFRSEKYKYLFEGKNWGKQLVMGRGWGR